MSANEAVDLDEIRARIRDGKPVRRTLPGGGRLHVDRPLPFLCVYRIPCDRPDLGTAELVRPQASRLIASGDPTRSDELARWVVGIVDSLADVCGACLLLELWSGPESSTPRIQIRTPSSDRLATTISTLADALGEMNLPVAPISIEVVASEDSSSDRPPLIGPELALNKGCLVVGLEMPPIYRSSERLYPLLLRVLVREVSLALQRCFFEFARVQTPTQPAHHHAMGRHRILRLVRDADSALTDIENSFGFLLDVTPVNTEEAWEEFCQSGRATAPKLKYRMLEVDPELGKRRLYELRLERLEDPALALLLRDKRREIDRKLSMLEDRDSPGFLQGSIQLYGGVDSALFAEAEAILAAVPPQASKDEAQCEATRFAARAREEIRRYPGLSAGVELRDDVPSLIVSRGSLLVPRRLCIPVRRVEALLQHEVGTHIVTAANGASQSLSILAVGFAGYEALQEGLALFAEHLTGGLDASRLRLIAARVVAVRRLIEGATFPDVVAELTDGHAMPLRSAFGVALRVFRGGGLTKDAIYLRGLLELLGYLAKGGSLEPLLVGKISIAQVAFVEELLQRNVLHEARLRPRWLDLDGAGARLSRARKGLRAVDLIETRKN